MAKSKTDKRKFTIAGLPVVDASMPLIVKITGKDIQHAKRRSSDCCAAARALCRENPEILEAHVYMSRTYLKKRQVIERYITPPALRLETMAHDRAGIFMPGEFTLGAPRGSLRLGQHAGGTKKTKTGKQPRAVHRVQGVRPVAPKGGRTTPDFK
jgi:hypothetical protein